MFSVMKEYDELAFLEEIQQELRSQGRKNTSMGSQVPFCNKYSLCKKKKKSFRDVGLFLQLNANLKTCHKEGINRLLSVLLCWLFVCFKY